MNQPLATEKQEFYDALGKAASTQDIMNLKASFLGKKGKISAILKGMKDATKEERATIGAAANLFKAEAEKALLDKQQALEYAQVNESLKKNRLDLTYRDSILDLGLNKAGIHPVHMIKKELEDIFLSLGFEVLDGPFIENDYYNFEALNTPQHHPARDMQDTFWFSDMKHLLRTHTSCIQIRGMEERTPPYRFVGPGKVFRCEATDASHEMVFHQMEGMMVGENISVANLIYFMKTLLKEIFGREVEVRLRPGFFPFVEPGFELDINCQICGGSGCRVCKNSGWVELLPCGMTHPNVLKYGNVDTDKYNGFAFGLGLDRLVMMRYGINDIRYLHSGNLQFSRQFASC